MLSSPSHHGFKAAICALSLAASFFMGCSPKEDPIKPDPKPDDDKPVVVAVTGVTLEPTSLSLKIGGTADLTATVSPDNATDKKVSWSSSKTSVATVKDGKVTAVAAGTATITAKAGGKSATCSVTVVEKEIPVEKIDLGYSSRALEVGKTFKMNALVTPTNATDKTVTWTTSDETVATVSKTGLVTGVAVGTATITATAGGKSASCEFVITGPSVPATGITITPSSLDIGLDQVFLLTATLTPSNATDMVTWSSSNAAVAEVEGGFVTGRSQGTATITAKAGTKSATCIVTVSPYGEEQIKNTLMKIYNAMDGPHWKMSNRWDLSKPLSEWEGVTWNKLTQTFYLSLSDENLGMKGQFPDCFDELPMLSRLSILKQPGITGTLPPSFGSIKNLQFLSIEGTSMTSMPDIFSGMPQLSSVGFYNNEQMTGPLPESLGSNTAVKAISVEGNHFTGTVPDSWARLGTALDIRVENYLSEYVPDSYVHAADADFLINSYLGLAKFRETPIIVGDYDVPAYLPRKKDMKDITTGKTIPFKQIVSQNKVTVLLTWATWCPHSAALIPMLKKMYDKYHKDGLEIITSVNAYPEERVGDNLQSIIRDRNMQSWYNFDEWNLAVTEMDCWSDGTPTAILVDKNGKVIMDSRENISDPARNRFGFSAATQLIPVLEDYFGPMEGGDDNYESTDYSQDGKVITIQKASTGKGINLVFMGDAYTDKDMASGKYEEMMLACAEEFFKIEPYKSFKNRFNVYAVKVVSKNGKTGPGYTTALGTRFTSDGSTNGNQDKVFQYAQKVPGISSKKDLVIGVLVNSIYPGGITSMIETQQSGIGYFTSYSNEPSAFGPVLRHEVGGHAFAFLADEYATVNSTVPQSVIDNMNKLYNSYGWYANVDFTDDAKKIRWANFLSDSRYKNEVGIYEGAATYRKGAYRPTPDSMMNQDVDYFNAPSRWAIYQRIMKLSGETPTFSKFLQYDAINRGSKPSSTPDARSREALKHCAPPVVTR